ncbi:MAG: tryptophan--tRNA ligase [Christensenellales bacterium]|jgi:tryptophanyl-tRNA synthetase
MEEKKTIYSGIQPTGSITIGNYIGAIKNWQAMQDDYNCIYSIVDLHSLTVRQQPAELRKRCTGFFAQLLACGLEPEKCIIYYQSHVSAHAELAWVLNTLTYIGEAQRMTQFKEKAAKNEDNLNLGLLNYPVLMAADILLYLTSLVPVGVDQKQHLELARDIAIRFNNRYSETFVIPEAYIPDTKDGAKVFSLQDPTAKMSKTDPDENAYVSIIDPPEVIMRKFKRAVTDSQPYVEYKEGKDGINNLITIMSAVTSLSYEDIVAEYYDTGYARFKQAVGEAVVEKLRPIREKYNMLMADKAYLEEAARTGAQKAAAIANKTLAKVYRKIGLVSR